MHALTKLLVALAAILAVFLSAVTIVYSANADRIVSDYNNALARAATADAALAAEKQRQGMMEAQVAADRKSWEERITQAEVRERNLLTENARLLTEKNTAMAGRESLDAKIKELSETVKTYATLISSYRDEVTRLRDGEIKDRERGLELNQKMADLESQRDVLQQTVRALQEQLAEARTAIDSAARGVAGAAKTVTPFVASGPVIQGRVESVQKDEGAGKTLVQLSVGSNDNVRENMKFFVVSKGNYAGSLVVTRVDQRGSVAYVDLVAPNMVINAGDEILSRLQ